MFYPQSPVSSSFASLHLVFGGGGWGIGDEGVHGRFSNDGGKHAHASCCSIGGKN